MQLSRTRSQSVARTPWGCSVMGTVSVIAFDALKLGARAVKVKRGDNGIATKRPL
jgi:hypothetical protein